MKRFLPIISLIVLLTMLVPVGLVSAAYGYSFQVRVFNNSTTSYLDGLPVLISINNSQLNDYGYIDADGLDTLVQEGASDRTSMIQTARLGVFIPSFLDSQTRFLGYRLGNTPEQTTFPIIVGVNGSISVPDAADLELGSNFTIEQSGYLDTTASGSNGYAVDKADAFQVWVDDAVDGTINAKIFSSTDVENAVQDSFQEVQVSQNRTGQRLASFSGVINSISGWMMKTGSPTGTLYARVWRVSDGALLGTAGSMDVSTLTGAYAWYLFDDTQIADPGGVDIYLGIEYNGGSGANYARIGRSDADETPGALWYYSSGTWYDLSPKDMTYRYSTDVSVTVNATGVSTGEHVVTTSIKDDPGIASYDDSVNIGVSMGSGILPVRILEKQTLVAPAASVTFSDITAQVADWDTKAGVTSRHLVVMVNAASADAVAQRDVQLQFNGDVGNTYNYQLLEGENAVATAARSSGVANIAVFPITGTTYANTFSGGTILIPHAFNTANHKATISIGGAAEDEVEVVAGRWADISAITSVALSPSAGNFATNSTFILGVVDERYLVEEDLFAVPAASAQFNAIPQDGSDLVVIGYARDDRVAFQDSLNHNINGDAVAANYLIQTLQGASATPSTSSGATLAIANIPSSTATANAFGGLIIFYNQYAEGTNDPHFLALAGMHEATVPFTIVTAKSGRRSNIAAITSLTFQPNVGPNLVTGTLFSLYRVPRYLIDRQKLTAPAATITFNNIPQGYEALQLLVYAKTDSGGVGDEYDVSFNGDVVAANYDYQRLQGVAAAVAAGRSAASRRYGYLPGGGAAANIFGGGTHMINQYSTDVGHKHTVSITGRAEALVNIYSNRWENTDAIISIALTPSFGTNFIAGSVFELVGVMPTKSFMIEVDGEVKGIASAGGLAVPDNSNDWLVGENNVWSYLDYMKLSVNGTQQLWFEPNTMIAGSVVTDRQGGDNNGAITWGTNPSNIEVTIGGLTSSVSAVSSVVVNETAPELLKAPPAIVYFPGAEDAELTAMPMYDSMVRFSDAIGAPVRVGYVLVIWLASMVMGVAGLVAIGSGWGFVAGYGFVNALALGTPVWPQFLPITGIFILILGMFVWGRVR